MKHTEKRRFGSAGSYDPPAPVTCSGSLLFGGLLADLPMHEGVFVTTPWAFPCALRGICIVGVNHFNDKVAVQTHGGLAVYRLRSKGLTHEQPPGSWSWWLLAIHLASSKCCPERRQMGVFRHAG